MKIIKDLIIEYTQKPIPEGLDVVKQSVPICFFGNLETAKIATIGINPAPDAFSSNPSLPDREDFSARDNDFLSLEQASKVYNALLTYFNHPYHSFFKKLETFISPIFNYHYLGGTMVHLDIVPWATESDWINVQDKKKEVLVSEYKKFFIKIINESNIKIFFVNGKTVKNQIQEVLKLPWVDKKIKTGKANTTISIAKKDGATFLASSRFCPNDHLKKQDRKIVQNALRDILGFPIENRPESNMDDTKNMIISKIKERIIIIKTKEKIVSERGNLYEAIRQWWKMDEDRANRAEYIFAIVRKKGEFVQEVYKPKKWHHENYMGHPRLVFEGDVAEDAIRLKYVGKKLPEKYWQKQGQANSIMYTYD